MPVLKLCAMQSITINCDGGSRGNPGPAASAFSATLNREVVHNESKFLGVATNNDAEYSAVILALRWISKSEYKHYPLNFILDSELVVRQIKGIYKIKNQKLKARFFEIDSLIKNLGTQIKFENVARVKNKIADSLVNAELDKNETP